MSLINCPECNKQVSNKATSCPNCGFPIDQNSIPIESEELVFPDLPIDLNIGNVAMNWSGGHTFTGQYNLAENAEPNISQGKIDIVLYERGIAFSNSIFSKGFPIHNSQLISLKKTTRSELIKLNKSIVGRAIIGGLVMGPIGAIVGGMTGLEKTEKTIDKCYLVINYWDIPTKKTRTLLIEGENLKVDAFIKSYEEQSTKISASTPLQPAPPRTPIGCYFIIGIIVTVVFMYIFVTIMSKP